MALTVPSVPIIGFVGVDTAWYNRRKPRREDSPNNSGPAGEHLHARCSRPCSCRHARRPPSDCADCWAQAQAQNRVVSQRRGRPSRLATPGGSSPRSAAHRPRHTHTTALRLCTKGGKAAVPVTTPLNCLLPCALPGQLGYARPPKEPFDTSVRCFSNEVWPVGGVSMRLRSWRAIPVTMVRSLLEATSKIRSSGLW